LINKSVQVTTTVVEDEMPSVRHRFHTVIDMPEEPLETFFHFPFDGLVDRCFHTPGAWSQNEEWSNDDDHEGGRSFVEERHISRAFRQIARERMMKRFGIIALGFTVSLVTLLMFV
jgi:hypothetical protein